MGEVVLEDGAFDHLGGFVDIINQYYQLQKAANSAVQAGLDLPDIFVDEGGEALRQQILEGAQNIQVALTDSTNTVDDLIQLGYSADAALDNIANADEVANAMLKSVTPVTGDADKLERPYYSPENVEYRDGKAYVKGTDQEIPDPDQNVGENSIQEQQEEAQEIIDQLNSETPPS